MRLWNLIGHLGMLVVIAATVAGTGYLLALAFL
jgi:hypothetical protein